jgi:hypothetical protein
MLISESPKKGSPLRLLPEGAPLSNKSRKLSTFGAVFVLVVVAGMFFHDAATFSVAVKVVLLCLIGFAGVYSLVKLFNMDRE